MASEHAAQLPRYKHLRKVGLQFNKRLVSSISKADLHEGGRRLGILRKGTLVFDSEDEMTILMDYCLHDVWSNGTNTVERFMAVSPPAPHSDEFAFLQALIEARYCMLLVETAERGVGVHVRELLRDEQFFLMDVGLGNTAGPGVVLATRIVVRDGIAMSTGANVPIGVLSPDQQERLVTAIKAQFRDFDFRNLTPIQSSELATTLIHNSLKRLADLQTSARNTTDSYSIDRPTAPSALPPRLAAGRNDPCPCGSGKKFKKCCGV